MQKKIFRSLQISVSGKRWGEFSFSLELWKREKTIKRPAGAISRTPNFEEDPLRKVQFTTHISKIMRITCWENVRETLFCYLTCCWKKYPVSFMDTHVLFISTSNRICYFQLPELVKWKGKRKGHKFTKKDAWRKEFTGDGL